MFRQKQLQKQKQITVYEKKEIYDAFYSSIEGLERYIKLTYPNFKIKKQIHNNKFENYYQSKAESVFTNLLLGLKARMEIVGKPKFLYDVIRAAKWGTFPYSWGFMLSNKTFNNDKGSTINLTCELAETERKINHANTYYQTEQIQTQYLQEVPTKQECRIM